MFSLRIRFSSQVEFVGFQLPSGERLLSADRAEASMRWRMNSEQVTWKMTWQLWRGDAFWTRQTQRMAIHGNEWLWLWIELIEIPKSSS